MTSESLSLRSASERGKDGDGDEDEPVESLWADGLELVSLFPPRPPTCILKTSAVCDRVLLAGHAPPGTPNVFFAPFMREIVDLALG